MWVDSSYRPDGKCQTGFVYHCYDKNKRVVESSDVFSAENINNAEILGIYHALKAIYEKYNITSFKVYCDSIIGVSMLQKNKKITKTVLKKHPVLQFVLNYIKENNLDVLTEHLERKHHMIKVADKASKRFRRE